MSKSIILALCMVTLSGCAQKIVWDSPSTKPNTEYYQDSFAYRMEQKVNARMDPKTKAKWDAIANSKTEEIEVIIIGVVPQK